MKNETILLLFLFFIVSVPLASSAPNIDMKSDFQKDETLIAKVSGNFYETISQGDIYFLTRGHVKTSIPYTVSKLGNDFYIYAQLLGKESGNYSMVIEDAKYFQSNQLIEAGIVENFTINSNQADFSVEPGFLQASDDFYIELKNLLDNSITISNFIEANSTSLLSANEESTQIISNDAEKLYFNVNGNKGNNLTHIQLISDSSNFSYEVPVYLTTGKIIPEAKRIIFEQSTIDLTMATNSENQRILSLKNEGSTDIENVSILLSDSIAPYVDLSTYDIKTLKGSSSVSLAAHVTSKADPKTVQGQIVAVSGDELFSATLNLNLEFIPDYIPEGGLNNEENNSELVDKTSDLCQDLNGTICSDNQVCSGEQVAAKDGVCCLATCSVAKSSSTGKAFGWTIIIIVLILLVWFYFTRYKKQTRVIDFFRFGRGSR